MAHQQLVARSAPAPATSCPPAATHPATAPAPAGPLQWEQPHASSRQHHEALAWAASQKGSIGSIGEYMGVLGALGAPWPLIAQSGPGLAASVPVPSHAAFKHQAPAGSRDRDGPGSRNTGTSQYQGRQCIKARLALRDWGNASHGRKEKGKTCQLTTIRAVTQSRHCSQSNMLTVIEPGSITRASTSCPSDLFSA